MKTKLLMLPFSGGGFYSYSTFLKYTPPWLELIPVDLPGHGKRLKEPLLSDIHQIMDDLCFQVYQHIRHPYAIYGHSMGAIVGYLLCRKIRLENLPEPVHLFVSGRNGPSRNNNNVSHLLPHSAFLREVQSYGGMPAEVLKEPELIDLFLPILRADFKAIETYMYEPAPPLGIPVTAMSGSEDDKVAFKDVMKWQDITHHPLSVREFEGGHFFIFQKTEEIMELIIRSLQNNRFPNSPDPMYQGIDILTSQQKEAAL